MSGNLLQEIVGSYVGALIQREHIKNKRLDDIMTTAGNDQQQSLGRMQKRLDKAYGTVPGSQTVASEGPSEDYGIVPRHLGVTPYPQPPSTTQVMSSDVQAEPPEAADAAEPDGTNAGADKASPVKPPEEPVSMTPRVDSPPKGISPMKAALLGAGLTVAGLGTGGAATALLMGMGNEPVPVVEEAEPAPSIVTPADSSSDARRGGAVDILVR